MAVENEAEKSKEKVKKVKQWIGWSWTYLWGVWFLTMIFLLYILRNPLRLKENFGIGKLLLLLSFGFNFWPTQIKLTQSMILILK